MSGTRIRPPILVEREAEILSRVEYRLMESAEEREEVYQLRYRAYLNESAVEPNPAERIEDKFDHMANSWVFGLYFEGALTSSIRVSCGSASRTRPTAVDRLSANALIAAFSWRRFCRSRPGRHMGSASGRSSRRFCGFSLSVCAALMPSPR